MFLLAGVLNVVLSVALARPLGLAGVALGTAIPNVLFAAAVLVMACRELGVTPLAIRTLRRAPGHDRRPSRACPAPVVPAGVCRCATSPASWPPAWRPSSCSRSSRCSTCTATTRSSTCAPSSCGWPPGGAGVTRARRRKTRRRSGQPSGNRGASVSEPMGVLVAVAAVVLVAAFTASSWRDGGSGVAPRTTSIPPAFVFSSTPIPRCFRSSSLRSASTINGVGERGDELPRLRAGETLYRVLVVGGSQPEGFFLDQDTAWPGALQRLLQGPEPLKSLGTSKVHVGSIARSGIGSEALDADPGTRVAPLPPAAGHRHPRRRQRRVALARAGCPADPARPRDHVRHLPVPSRAGLRLVPAAARAGRDRRAAPPALGETRGRVGARGWLDREGADHARPREGRPDRDARSRRRC